MRSPLARVTRRIGSAVGGAIALGTLTTAAFATGSLPPLPPLEHHGLTVTGWAAVDRQPGNPATGFGSVWVPSSATGLLDRVDPRSLRVVARIRSATVTTSVENEYFDSVAISPTAVWHASDLGNLVARIDPRRNRAVAVIPVPGRPDEIAATASAAYVGLFNTTRVVRISAQTNKIARQRDIGSRVLGITSAGNRVWVVTDNGPAVLQLDPVTLRVEKRIGIKAPQLPFVGGYFSAWWISADATTVCVGEQQQNAVAILDATKGKLRAVVKLPFGRQPFSVVADGAGCVATNDSGVFGVGADGSTPTGSQLPPLGPSAFTGVASDAGAVWVTVAGRNALVRAERR